nr:hypothetical protein L204_04560 [Cryptococcus depauperatus CBS 7855]
MRSSGVCCGPLPCLRSAASLLESWPALVFDEWTPLLADCGNALALSSAALSARSLGSPLSSPKLLPRVCGGGLLSLPLGFLDWECTGWVGCVTVLGAEPSAWPLPRVLDDADGSEKQFPMVLYFGVVN